MTLVDGRCSPVRTAVKVFLFCRAIMLLYFLLPPGGAPGGCPWHNRKCPDPVMSLCVEGGLSSPLKRKHLNDIFSSYDVPVLFCNELVILSHFMEGLYIFLHHIRSHSLYTYFEMSGFCMIHSHVLFSEPEQYYILLGVGVYCLDFRRMYRNA